MAANTNPYSVGQMPVSPAMFGGKPYVGLPKTAASQLGLDTDAQYAVFPDGHVERLYAKTIKQQQEGGDPSNVMEMVDPSSAKPASELGIKEGGPTDAHGIPIGPEGYNPLIYGQESSGHFNDVMGALSMAAAGGAFFAPALAGAGVEGAAGAEGAVGGFEPIQVAQAGGTMTDVAPGLLEGSVIPEAGGSVVGYDMAGEGLLESLGLPSVLTNPSVLGAGAGLLLSGLGGNKTGTVPTTSTTTTTVDPWVRDHAEDQFLTQKDINQQYRTAAKGVSSGVNSLFEGAGRYGSGAHQGVLGATLGDLRVKVNDSAKARNAALLTGLPSGGTSTTNATQPYYSNGYQSLLGGALTGSLLGKYLGG